MINNGLARGLMFIAMSLWASPGVFIGKKDNNLQQLIALTEQKEDPLCLTIKLVDSPLDADTYTKLDTHNAYVKMVVANVYKDRLVSGYLAGKITPLTMAFGWPGAPGYF